jgi:diguanylate cyclase (GGDEF)-like protein
MRKTFREVDTAARIGGEEFAVVLPGTDLTAARTVAERLRKLVAKTPLVQDKRKISMTVSIGVATIDPRDSEADQILIRADKALYRAKENGRNQVEMAADQSSARLSLS